MSHTAPNGSDPTFAQKVIDFNTNLLFDAPLPPGISVMNPFRENACAIPASTAFYRKYYDDHRLRRIILGINPGRFGAGRTGIPFTDPKRLAECCQIHIADCPSAHEPSSVFVYEVIAALGGETAFYRDWYINSICPLGFTSNGKNGRQKNFNYYDHPDLQRAALPFMLESLQRQLAFGIRRDACFCFGMGKNAVFIEKLNDRYGFFEKIVPLEHPRYIAQYKWKERREYINKYISLFGMYSS